MKKILSALMILIVALCAGCGGASYKHVTHDEARKIISENSDAVILDVRTPEEFDKKRIQGALLLPLEDLKEGKFDSLPTDKNATILTYCRTGRRAEEAAGIIAGKGYKNVYEMGGIIDWAGPFEGAEVYGYKTISQEEAMKILEEDPNARLLDCRFPKDYEMRHIPNAIHYPLEAAVAENFEKIPDKDAPLITYCGDGNRGRLTAKVLVEKGFTNVYTMGGIIDWKGPVEGTEVE